MLFTSPTFLFLFLPIVLALYFFVPKKLRNLLLLLVSLFFYSWGEGIYAVSILIIVFANYLFALLIGHSSKKSRFWLVIAIIFDLSYLFYFKYFVFFLANLNRILAHFGHSLGSIPNVHLPLAVSFVTFHILSYIFDVYRKTIKAESNLFNLLLYILLFPHLIAGPIVRYAAIGPQIKKRKFNSELFADGVKRFIMGLFKKAVIADSLSPVADKIFATFPQYLSTSIVWLGLLCYTLQIYYDFAGYSDMAIGLAKMFGFTFAENFNYPYISKSTQEFWRRWHITLSSWFRDYVYIPLGGNRKGEWRTFFNIGFVFLLTGLWHGASWHFVFWGGYYGFFLILEHTKFGELLSKLAPLWQHLYALTVIIIGWLFFRIDSISYAFYLLKVLFGINPNKVAVYHLNSFLNGEILLIFIIGLLLATPYPSQVIKKLINKASWTKQDQLLRPSLGMIFSILILIYALIHLASSTYSPFIYFRF